ncbi:hypothetical protein LZ31DRAFT_553439 [Colletotrichum somersetense]|nr:hypothetical protein LZ31DRAFT_553439 [Colletotrichum somersetense]
MGLRNQSPLASPPRPFGDSRFCVHPISIAPKQLPTVTVMSCWCRSSGLLAPRPMLLLWAWSSCTRHLKLSKESILLGFRS